MIGDFLYQLTPRDQQVTGIEFVNRGITTVQNAAGINDSFVVPPGRLFLMNFARLQGDPDAAQSVSNLTIQISPNVGGNSCIISQPTVAGAADKADGRIHYFSAGGFLAGKAIITSWTGEIWLPPGGIVTFLANFTAPAVGNGLDSTLCGILIPKGTVVG